MPLGERKERITLMDTPFSAIAKLSDGNPGALTVLSRIFNEGSKIDPDAGFGEAFFIILNFDSYGIFGPQVWMLYKDVCGERLDRTIALVRATQMGIISEAQLKHAINNRGAGLDVKAVCSQLKERLPNFTFTEEPPDDAVVVDAP